MAQYQLLIVCSVGQDVGGILMANQKICSKRPNYGGTQKTFDLPLTTIRM
jgi:hypothetical protein